MLVIAHHNISKPKEFWEKASEVTSNLPPTLKAIGMYPSTDHKTGTCIWEASSVQELQQYLDRQTGDMATNFCYEVNVKESVGLPDVKLSDALAN